jgi:hypothetical protein
MRAISGRVVRLIVLMVWLRFCLAVLKLSEIRKDMHRVV